MNQVTRTDFLNSVGANVLKAAGTRSGSPDAPAPNKDMPIEPLLEMGEIQGIAVPGFFKPHQTLIYVRFPASRDGLLKLRDAMRGLLPEVATAAETLEDRRGHRVPTRAQRRLNERKVLVAIAFSANGLVRLTPGAREIPSPAFQGGLLVRSSLLGDPTTQAEEGNPANWVVGRPGEELDALVVIAGDSRATVDAEARAVLSLLSDARAMLAKQVRDSVIAAS